MVVGLMLIIVQTSRDSASPAVAQEETSQLTATVSPKGCATVTAQLTSDASTPEPATEWTFATSAYVKLTAKVMKGCTFTRWELTLGGQPFWNSSQNPFQFQLIGDIELTARFTGESDNPTTLAGITVSPGTLTLLEGDSATVTVTLDSDPGEAIDVVLTADGTTADLTFTPATLSWTVAAWQDSKTVTVTAVSDTTAEAPETYTLSAVAYQGSDTTRATSILLPVATGVTLYDRVTLTTSVTGPGSLTPSSTTAHRRGQTVTLTAVPDEGKYLRAWGGACANTEYTSDTCELTLEADSSVTATFGNELPFTQLLVINDGAAGNLLLEWMGYPEGTTSWQYRQREWQGSDPPPWGNWTAIPSSTVSTRSYRLAVPARRAAYEFEVRGVGTNLVGATSVGALVDPWWSERVPAYGTTYETAGHSIGVLEIIEGDGTTAWGLGDFTVIIPDGMRVFAGRPWIATCSVDQPHCATEGVPLIHYTTGSNLMFSIDGGEVARWIVEDDAPVGGEGAADSSATVTVDALFDQIVASVREAVE